MINDLIKEILEIINDPIVEEEIHNQYGFLSIRADDAYQEMFEIRNIQLERIEDKIKKYNLNKENES